MKTIFIISLLLIITSMGFCQNNQVKILSSKEVNQLLNEGTKTMFNISYPIFRVYQYESKKEKLYLVLTESVDEVKGKDSLSKNIKAIVLKELNGELNRELEISDAIIPTLNEEYSISFWTKYMAFEKIGSTITPIIVYGTKGMYQYSDGRIKIVIYHNNQKIVIRHQNAVLDGERLTTIDKAFYTLPTAIQNTVKRKITEMEKSEHTILGYGWEDAMKKKKLEIKG